MKKVGSEIPDMTEGDHYVADTEYQLLWKSRNENKRSSTDLAFHIIFGLISILWLGIGIHGFQANDGIPGEIIDKIDNWIEANKIMDALDYSKGACFGFAWLCILFIALFFIMVRWVTKVTIYATLVLAVLNQLFVNFIVLQRPSFLPVVITFTTWIFYGVTIYAIKKLGSDSVCKILQDSCKTMICFPSSFLIILLEIVLGLGVIIFTFGATVYLLFIEVEYVKEPYRMINDYSSIPLYQTSIRQKFTVNPPAYATFLLPIFIMSAFWILGFIGTLRRMLLHGIFAHWYRASDKKNISNTVGLRCGATISRYHLGTVAFLPSIFAVIPAIGAVVKHARNMYTLIKKRPSTICSLWMAFWGSMINASVICVSYGTNLSQSTKDGFQLAMRNPLKYLLSTVVCNLLSLYGVLLVPLMVTLLSYFYFVSQLSSIDPNFHEAFLAVPLIITLCTSVMIAVILIVIFKNASEAVIVCFLEESNLSKTTLQDEDYEV